VGWRHYRQPIGWKTPKWYVFAVNSMAAELRLSVDILREQGIKAGLLRPRLYLPFPAEDIINALPKNAQVMVLDRNYNFAIPAAFWLQN
jgi:pyruvate/2-oxoacid:ferredoxin oxidoreductase alpha subunit